MTPVLSQTTPGPRMRRSLSGLLLAGTALCSAVALSAAGGMAISTYVPAGQIAAVDLTPPKTAASNAICLGGPTAAI